MDYEDDNGEASSPPVKSTSSFLADAAEQLGIVEATEPQVYLGLMPPTCDKNGVPGKANGTVGLEGTGDVYANGATIGNAGVTFAKGDLLKVEYDSDLQVRSTRNAKPTR